MTLSTDFAICPWCRHEDSTWTTYYTKPTKKTSTIVCDGCKKPYKSIMTVEFIKVPVCEHDRKQLGDFIIHPSCHFETRKIMGHEHQKPKESTGAHEDTRSELTEIQRNFKDFIKTMPTKNLKFLRKICTFELDIRCLHEDKEAYNYDVVPLPDK